MQLLKRHSVSSWIAPILTLFFGVMMMCRCLEGFQAPEVSELFAPKVDIYVKYALFLTGIFLLYVLFCKVRRVRIIGFLSGIYIVTIFGLSYRIFFGTPKDFEQECLFTLMGLAIVAPTVCIIVRRVRKIPNWFYYMAFAVTLGLLLYTYKYGVSKNGARLWLNVGSFSIQPGEFIRVFIIFICAYSNRDVKRYTATAILAVICCGIYVLSSDFGTVAVIFLCFLQIVFVLWNNKKLSLLIIAFGVVAIVLAYYASDKAHERLADTFHAMENTRVFQQRKFITGAVLGGFKGLGIQNHFAYTKITEAGNDGAILGVQAVYGISGVFLLIGGYAMICQQTLRARSYRPQDTVILFQGSAYIMIVVLLNYLGAADVAPFTGICAPLVSTGGSSTIAASMVLGAMAGAMYPHIESPKAD